jgi:hypothetical protein
MATLLIPVLLDAAYSAQRTRLDGRDYLLEFAFNEREDRWYLSISDDESAPIITGLKLITGLPLLRFYRADPRVPPGELIAMTLSQDESPPAFSDFGAGRRVELTYFDAATLAALRP